MRIVSEHWENPSPPVPLTPLFPKTFFPFSRPAFFSAAKRKKCPHPLRVESRRHASFAGMPPAGSGRAAERSASSTPFDCRAQPGHAARLTRQRLSARGSSGRGLPRAQGRSGGGRRGGVRSRWQNPACCPWTGRSCRRPWPGLCGAAAARSPATCRRRRRYGPACEWNEPPAHGRLRQGNRTMVLFQCGPRRKAARVSESSSERTHNDRHYATYGGGGGRA